MQKTNVGSATAAKKLAKFQVTQDATKDPTAACGLGAEIRWYRQLWETGQIPMLKGHSGEFAL